MSAVVTENRNPKDQGESIRRFHATRRAGEALLSSGSSFETTFRVVDGQGRVGVLVRDEDGGQVAFYFEYRRGYLPQVMVLELDPRTCVEVTRYHFDGSWAKHAHDALIDRLDTLSGKRPRTIGTIYRQERRVGYDWLESAVAE